MIEATAHIEGASPMTEDLFAQAMALHEAWDFDGAERLYAAVLRANPQHADAHHNLGVLLAIQMMQPQASLPHFENALNLNSSNAQYWFSYVDALIRSGQPDLARQVLDLARAHGLQPAMAAVLSDRLDAAGSAEAVNVLLLPPELSSPASAPVTAPEQVAGRQAPVQQHQQQLNLPPADVLPQSEKHLLVDMFRGGRFKEGEAYAKALLEKFPNEGFLWKALGTMLQPTERKEEALRAKQRAAELLVTDAEAWSNLGRAYFELQRPNDAVTVLEKSLAIRSDHAETQAHMGLALNAIGRVNDARDYFLRALELNPTLSAVYNNLSGIYTAQGLVREALAALRKAIEVQPDFRVAFDNLLFVLNYDAEASAEEVYAMYAQYDRTFGEPQRKNWLPFTNRPHAGRRLRVGYVSPDFRHHACMMFMEPLLANHDHSKLEIFAYAEVANEDHASQRVKGYVDHWVPVNGMSDDDLAARIRADEIDILVDLAGHTKSNRLGAFARKPTPVSLSWMGFGYTTGLKAIDYFLTDETSAPPGCEHLFSEQPWRLPGVPFTAYRPVAAMGEVNALPALSTGVVTFGSLTRGVRLNDRCIGVWSQILLRLPNSRLVVDSASFADPALCRALVERFVALGVDADRLLVGFHSPPWDVLRSLDISLDCFPHNSGTTLFESLYMGVPYVTLADRPSVGRIGSSILQGLGRSEWIAHSDAEYIEKVLELAQNLPQLAKTRASLRAEMQASALMDEVGFTHRVEDAYAEMFARWSATQEAHSTATPAPLVDASTTDELLALQAELLYTNSQNLEKNGQYAQALQLLDQALQLRPQFYEAHNNRGAILQRLGQLEEAQAAYNTALAIHPDYAVAHHNLGNALQHRGDLVAAVACYQRALSLGLDSQHLYDNLLFLLNYHPTLSPQEIFKTYSDYDRLFGAPHRAQWRPHDNSCETHRTLRVGYVSPDFRQHACTRFLEPLLAAHDRQVVEVFAYAEVTQEDDATARYQALVDHWVPTAGLSDDALAQRIRDDRIDILVDLAGHTKGNRLSVFARKPAPVSVSWMGYGYTTGLKAIDYYLTDEASVPMDAEAVFSEKPWRLPGAPFAVFRPSADMGEVNPLPALQRGHVVLGSLTRSIRLNEPTLQAWAEILRRVPTARLVLDSRNFADASVAEGVVRNLEDLGVARGRMEVGCHSPPWDVLSGMDIALDCFPHNSGTTLYESLYMGLPFITLAGRPSVGRIGSAILQGLGRPEWIAHSVDEYVDKVVALAQDLPALAQLRAALRPQMQASALMNEAGFARSVEAAYQDMFALWAQRQQDSAASSSDKTSAPPIPSAPGAKAAVALSTAFGPTLEEKQKLADLFQARRFAEGETFARELIARCPSSGFAWKALGVMLQPLGRQLEALQVKTHAAELLPYDAEVHANLGHLLQAQGRFAEAEAVLKKALALQPDGAAAHNNLAITYQKMGRLDESIEHFQQALALSPKSKDIYSNLLFTANYHPDWSADRIFDVYRTYDERYSLPFRGKWAAHTNTRTPGRVLRVGYVSPDFRNHACCRFLEPLLVHHDKTKVEVTAYAELAREDDATQRYRQVVDHWVSTHGMTDTALAERIRADGIDILVDVAGHTVGNRLGVFARKPAPVSLTWLGFGYTTGLSAIDYYLTDAVTVPQGSEPLFAEAPWRLPVGWTYRPSEGMGEVSALPALQNGYVTLGTLTRNVRINHHTVSAWVAILQRLPQARLVVDSSSFSDPAAQQELIAKFTAAGIAAERLHVGYHSPPWDVMRGIDIGLDCFPHNSGTTLFESLYMGVPYVTLADRPSVGRLGSAILQACGQEQWIAQSSAEYVDKVVALAQDLPTLARIRAQLRGVMLASPLMDEAGFTRSVEHAYAQMFAQWCTESPDPLEALVQRAENAYNLGVESAEAAEWSEAEIHLRRALSLVPEFAEANSQLGLTLQHRGASAEAEKHFRATVALQKESPAAHYNLGMNLLRQGQWHEAERSLRTALTLRPDFPEALTSLDRALQAQQRWVECEMLWRGVLLRDPEFIPGYVHLSTALRTLQRSTEALACIRRGLQIDPDSLPLQMQLGVALKEVGQFEEAEKFALAVLERNPESAQGWNNVAEVWNGMRRLVEAEEGYRKALVINPQLAQAHGNLGIVLQNQGRLHEAEASMRRGMELLPRDVTAHGNLLFVLNYHPDKSGAEVFAEYRAFDDKFAVPLREKWRPHTNSRDANRILKVGFVSPDFRNHSVGYFLEPLLAEFDKSKVHVYAYAELRREDGATARYKSYVDHWVPTRGMSDEALAERIRADGIDILVDLAGHTGGNRLGTFALKPAPVSVSWMGYGYTTGLSAIDYYLTDVTSAPPGSESYFAETPWRLPMSWVYRPIGAPHMGEVGELPAAKNGFVTFGTLTRAIRVNHLTVRVWSELLKRVPGSRLVINSSSYKDAQTQEELAQRFMAHGVERERLLIGFSSPPWDVLRGIDIGLDCFPHNSGTTLFETLYMGLPFVTLTGRPSVGGMGGSILQGLGRPEWIASTEAEYIDIAAALAQDHQALARLRAGLREEMRASLLMNEPAFARSVEDAFRQMFIQWCSENV